MFSRTCTGPTRDCSTSSITSPTGRWNADRPSVHGAAGVPRSPPGWGARPNACDDFATPSQRRGDGNAPRLLLRQTPCPRFESRAPRAEGNPLYAEEFVGMLSTVAFSFATVAIGRCALHLPVPGLRSSDHCGADRLLDVPEKGVLREPRYRTGALAGRSPRFPGSSRGRPRAPSFPRAEGVRAKAGIKRRRGRNPVLVPSRTRPGRGVGQISRADEREASARSPVIEALGRPEDHSETIAHHYLQALEYARNAAGESGFAERGPGSARAGDRALALTRSLRRTLLHGLARALPGRHHSILFRLGTARFRAVGKGGELLDERERNFWSRRRRTRRRG